MERTETARAGAAQDTHFVAHPDHDVGAMVTVEVADQDGARRVTAEYRAGTVGAGSAEGRVAVAQPAP